ncbi:MAG: tetratricopeptide repeat protein [Terracidiphilus sp.]
MTDEPRPGQNNPTAVSTSGDWLRQTLDDLTTSLRPGGFAEPGEPSGRVTMVGPDSCPDPGTWLRLALKDLPQEETEKLLAHAAMCANCLHRLRQSRQMISTEASEEDSVDPKDFESSSPNWQRKFAARLAETPRKSASSKIPPFAWWAAAGLAATLVAAFAFNVWYARNNSPQRLLARAYTQSRAFDLRITGAAFAPVVPQSSQGGNAAGNESPALLSARAILQRRLGKHPADPQLLQLQARADLLSQQDGDAIDILDRLLAQGPVTTALLTDDASAYFQRGLANGSRNDRATALENLRRADALAPDNSVVLFNEAIVLENLGMIANAIDVWNRYLKAEKDPQWLAEGRRRLQRLQQLQGRLQDRLQDRQEQTDRLRPHPVSLPLNPHSLQIPPRFARVPAFHRTLFAA